jgi:hypothetical protein
LSWVSKFRMEETQLADGGIIFHQVIVSLAVNSNSLVYADTREYCMYS